MGTEDKMSHMLSIRVALRTLPVAVVFAASFALSGCGGYNDAGLANSEPEYRHPIAVDQDVQTLTVAAPRDKSGLSDEDRHAVAAFATGYKDRGHGALTVSTPSGSPNTTTAMNILVDVRDALAEKGIAPNAVNYTPYRASAANTDAPIILSYKRYVATPSACGDWSSDYADDPTNNTPPNFGCASQNNLAVLVADPADLVTPRDSTPRDGARSAVVLGKYRQGQITATERSANDSAAVSEVGK